MEEEKRQPMSSRERSKKYRNKHKEKVKEKNRKRMKALRENFKKECTKNAEKAYEYRKKERERKRAYRLKKSEENIETTNLLDFNKMRGSYKSPQSFGKAVKKLSNALPKSPKKKIAVIHKIATQQGLLIPKVGEKKLNQRLKVL